MRRKKYPELPLHILLLFVLVLLSAGCAKHNPKVHLVGILSGVEEQATTADGFKAGMADLGYVENRNIKYDLRRVNDDPPAVDRILGEFLAGGVDLIFTFPSEAAKAAKAATQGKTVSVVFAWSTTEEYPLVESVSRPGGNITGVRLYASDLICKRLEILLRIAPRIKRVWLPYDPKIGSISSTIDSLRSIASKAGASLVETQIANIEALRTELERRAGNPDVGFDAIMIMPSAAFGSAAGWDLASKFFAARRLPVAGQSTWQVENENGAVFSYSPENESTGRMAATLADKILKGAPAGSIPVLSAEGSLVLNYRTAQSLGITVPEGLLRQADKIIR